MCAPTFEAEPAEFNGENDHPHPPADFPPKAAARSAGSLKDISSRRPRQELPDQVRHYYRTDKLWSGSSIAGSAGGASPGVVHRYIQQQNRSGQSAARAWRPSRRAPSPLA
ncbi:transposase [Actinomadura parmotrematis]|uniref:Transposase n=1 Tax=Actinomadura parmotrematis TaxID=2864039 RepID=A0ABS7FNU2_9ACTN|nr:transposase [Actinomadura parmotrematis]